MVIVVTGLGVITSLGAGRQQFEEALFAGRSGIAAASSFNGAAAAEIADFTPVPWLGSKGNRMLDRAARLLCVAAKMALDDAGVQPDTIDESAIGLVCGTMYGGVHSITSFDFTGATEGPNSVNPAEFPNTVINSPTGQAGIKFKLRGVNSTISAGFASGLLAIGYASDFLRFDRARLLLAGGLEELSEEALIGCSRAGLASPSGSARPFCRDRDGTVLGEGSALWALERDQDARARGATPLLEIAGFGASHSDPSAAMYSALDAAGVRTSSVACIFASANGGALDETEAQAIREVFGGGAPPVCAPKAAWGEAMGASGALAAAAAGLALQRQELPPTPCFRGTDSGLDLSAQARPIAGDSALIHALDLDGTAAALVIRLCRN